MISFDPPQIVQSGQGVKFGYNDLEMRKQKLCGVLRVCNISSSKVAQIAIMAPLQPFAFGAH